MTSATDRVEFDRRVFLVNTVSSVLATLISIVLLIWVNQYLLTRLTPEEYAPYPLVYSVLALLQVLESFFIYGIGRFVTEEYAKGNRERATTLASSMFVVCGAGAVLFILVGLLVAYHIDLVLEIEPGQLRETQAMFALLVVNQAFSLLLAPLSVGTYVLQRFALLNLIQLTREVLRALLIVALLATLGPSVTWVVVATVIASIVTALWKLRASIRLMPELRFRPQAVSFGALRATAAYGGWAMFGNLLANVHNVFDPLLLNRTSSAFQVNANHIATLPRRQLDQLYSMAANNLQPSLIGMHARSETVSLRDGFLRGSRYYLWMALAANVPLIAFADDLMRLYLTDAFLPVGPVIAVYCVASSLGYSSGLLYAFSFARGQVGPLFMLSALALSVHVSLATVLVWKVGLGAFGIALSKLLTGFFIQPLFWRLALRLVDARLGRFFRESIVPGYLPFVASLAAGLAFTSLVGTRSWSALAAGCLVCGATYLLAVLLALREEDREELGLLTTRLRALWTRVTA